MKGREAVKTVKWFLQFTIPLTPWNIFHLLFYFPLIVTMPFSLSPADVVRHRSYWHFQSKGCFFLPLDFHFFFYYYLTWERAKFTRAIVLVSFYFIFLFLPPPWRSNPDHCDTVVDLVWCCYLCSFIFFLAIKVFQHHVNAFYFYLF